MHIIPLWAKAHKKNRFYFSKLITHLDMEFIRIVVELNNLLLTIWENKKAHTIDS